MNIFTGLLAFIEHKIVIVVRGDISNLRVPIDVELGDPGFVREDMPNDSVDLYILRGVQIHLFIVIEVVNVVPHSEELLIIIRAAQ